MISFDLKLAYPNNIWLIQVRWKQNVGGSLPFPINVCWSTQAKFVGGDGVDDFENYLKIINGLIIKPQIKNSAEIMNSKKYDIFRKLKKIQKWFEQLRTTLTTTPQSYTVHDAAATPSTTTDATAM